MDDKHGNHERLMEDIITRSTNIVPTYTNEECSQADRFLDIHMTEGGDVTAED
jgi:hypothetical protein